MLSDLDFEPGIERQEEVDPGTELDEAHFRSLLDRGAYLQVVANAARQQPGNLSDEDLGAPRIDYQGVAFVLGRRLGVPGGQVAPRMVLVMGNCSANRVAVAMYVEDGHKNGNLQTLVVEVFAFLRLLNDDDPAVGRGVDQTVVFFGRVAHRMAEELQDQREEQHGKQQYDKQGRWR